MCKAEPAKGAARWTLAKNCWYATRLKRYNAPATHNAEAPHLHNSPIRVRLKRQSRIARPLAVVVGLGMLITACERGSPATPSASSSINIPADLSFCADEVNRYRATVGRAPLARSTDLEAFAAQAAENDGRVHQAHHLFAVTNGGGTAIVETEILWWRGQGVRTVIQQGLRQMWQSGPSGEHYDIIAGAYSQVGCGIFVNGAEVTVAQDFR
jgi:hypothetical protein